MTARLSSLWLPAACVAGATIACTALDPRTDNQAFVAVVLVWAALACGAAWTVRQASAVPRWTLVAAVALRAIALGLPLTLSDDVFRYLWEGQVQVAGHNPFLYAPEASELAALRDGIWEQVNHKGVSTIYPPLALHLFTLVSALAYVPLTWKIVAGLADLALLHQLGRLVRARSGRAWAIVAYALHPLPVLESAGSGHLEPLALLALVVGLRLWDAGRVRGAWLALAVGAGIKILPAVAGVSMLRRVRADTAVGALGGGLLLGLATLPFLAAGPTLLRGFGTYYESWAFNAALFPWIQTVAGDAARPVAVGVGALACAIATLRLRDPARLALFVGGALVLLSPVVHPWYVLWALVPALCVGAWPWLVLASTTLSAYLVLGTLDPTTGAWTEAGWVRWLEYPPMALAGLWWWRRRTKPWSAPGSAPGGGSSSFPTPRAAST